MLGWSRPHPHGGGAFKFDLYFEIALLQSYTSHSILPIGIGIYKIAMLLAYQT